MEIYIVEQITEADFGCEESGRKEPMALLKLKLLSPSASFLPPEKYAEISEKELEEKGIGEGKKVCFTPEGKILKYVRVVAALICDDMAQPEKIFATARGYGEYKDWWEFPGGKIEEGETSEEALKREIREELETEIRVGALMDTVEYDYPAFHLSMDCFWSEVESGELRLLEAEEARWLSREELKSIPWLPADITLIDRLYEKMNGA